MSTASGTPRYTHGHEASTLASHGRRTAENSCAYLLPHLRPGMSPSSTCFSSEAS